MSEAPESREAQGEITVNELYQYLQKSIRPSVIPSTFRVVEMEFRRLADEHCGPRVLLEQMMLFFRDSHRIVYEKLMDLYGGLYMPPLPAGAAPLTTGLSAKQSASMEIGNMDWDDTGDNDATARARAEMPTFSENDLLEKIFSMPTAAPPPLMPQPAQPMQDQQPLHTVQESVVREIPGRGVRTETPTIPDMGKTAELAEQIRAEIEFFGADAQDLPAPAQQEDSEDSDPGFHDRITLVEAPSPELIKKSSYPPPPGEDESAEAGESAGAGESLQSPDRSGTTAASALFDKAEEIWFEEGEKAGEE